MSRTNRNVLDLSQDCLGLLFGYFRLSDLPFLRGICKTLREISFLKQTWNGTNWRRSVQLDQPHCQCPPKDSVQLYREIEQMLLETPYLNSFALQARSDSMDHIRNDYVRLEPFWLDKICIYSPWYYCVCQLQHLTSISIPINFISSNLVHFLAHFYRKQLKYLFFTDSTRFNGHSTYNYWCAINLNSLIEGIGLFEVLKEFQLPNAGWLLDNKSNTNFALENLSQTRLSNSLGKLILTFDAPNRCFSDTIYDYSRLLHLTRFSSLTSLVITSYLKVPDAILQELYTHNKNLTVVSECLEFRQDYSHHYSRELHTALNFH